LQLLTRESNGCVEKVKFLIERKLVSYREFSRLVYAGRQAIGKPTLMNRMQLRMASGVCAAAILDGILPRHCILCGLASGEENLCPPCAAELPRTGHGCAKCGLPLRLSTDRICGACLVVTPPWDDAIGALLYHFPVDQLVCRFKFGRNLACGQVLARELATAVNEKCEETPDCIVPVPLHRTRLFLRTFNQAELLARQLGKNLAIPVRDNILYRVRRTRAQSGLDAADRRKNMKGAFRCRRIAAVSPAFEHVAVIDDVMTTGVTLAECTRTLQRAGALRVSAWVAARAPAP